MKRLYCTGEGADRKFCLTASGAEAARVFGGLPVRTPTAEDIRAFWEEQGLSHKPSREVAKTLGVSHQSICNWRMKACIDVPRKTVPEDVREMVLRELGPTVTVSGVAKKLGLSQSLVAKIATTEGVAVRRGAIRRPPDEEIIRLSEGRSWRELAEVCGMVLGSLRNYVYARPQLSQALRSKMRHASLGTQTHGRVDPETMRKLHGMGISAYGMANFFGVEQMTIHSWLDKLGLRKGETTHGAAGLAQDE